MPMDDSKRIWVCASTDLAEKTYRCIDVSYNGEATSVVIFRFEGKCQAYRNLCVHMPRTLDCEERTIFDKEKQNLRCSMHGIIYDPFSGASLSTMCNGECLTAIKVQEDNEGVWIRDKRVQPA